MGINGWSLNSVRGMSAGEQPSFTRLELLFIEAELDEQTAVMVGDVAR